MSTAVCAVVVARKGSTRVPGKMHQRINGESLVSRKVRQLRSAVGTVYVGTDDESIRDAVEDAGAVFVRRPDYFCDESACTPNEMVSDMLGRIGADHTFVLWAHPTNPLTTMSDYIQALELFFLRSDHHHQYDSLFSASRLEGHFWHQGQPVNFVPGAPKHVVARDLEPVYRMNGAIFIRGLKAMRQDGKFLGKTPSMFQMNEVNGWDIDYPWQLDCARTLAEMED